MEDLRIGVIGAGGRGGLARLAHKPGEGSRLVGGVDTQAKSLERFRELIGDEARTYSDYRELLDQKDIDAVFVCTPDFLHEEHAVAALQAGKAVYLEKPMAITVEGCDRILKTAMDTGNKLYVGHNMRHFPVILKMKEVIDSGIIGNVEAVWCRHFVGYGGDAYFKNWCSQAKYSTGLLLQKGTHDIDVIHWLAGGYTRLVTGMGKLSVYNRCERRRPDAPGDKSWKKSNWPPLSQTGMSPEMDVEDHTMILMQMDNGVQAAYMQCHYTPDEMRNYTFIGTQGRVENIGDHGDARVVVYTQREGYELGPDIDYHIKPKSGTHGGADPDVVDRFVRFVRDGVRPSTSPIAARQSVATGVMGTKSVREGNLPMEIPPVDQTVVDYFLAN